MLDLVKKALRIKSDVFDDEISLLIEAAQLELATKGVFNQPVGDPLIGQAVVVYCKANFGIGNADSEKYQKSFDTIVKHLACCKEYRGD